MFHTNKTEVHKRIQTLLLPNDKYEDMLNAGIIDPVKVTKSALLNATSIASMLLTTEVAIVKTPDKSNLDLSGLLTR